MQPTPIGRPTKHVIFIFMKLKIMILTNLVFSGTLNIYKIS